MDTIEPKQSYLQIREHTVSPRVLSVLAARNISLNDVLHMSRQEFEALTSEIHKLASRDEKRTLIEFKHHSMTKAETDAYFAPTEEEYDAVERDPEYQAYIHAVMQRQ